MNCGVGFGVFSNNLGFRHSYRLPDEASVFQAEILAVREVCKLIRDRNIQGNIGLFVDSQTAILSLKSPKTTSILVRQCKEELLGLSRLYDITIVWVPAHRDYYGNEQADELARAGSALNASLSVSVAIALVSVKSRIQKHYLEKAKNRWRNLDKCRVAKESWPT